MLLAIDAGNTNVVFALLDGREIKARWRIATDPRRTGDEYAVWLAQLLELEGFTRDDVTQATRRPIERGETPWTTPAKRRRLDSCARSGEDWSTTSNPTSGRGSSPVSQ